MIAGLHFVRKRTQGRPICWYVYAWRGGPRVMRVESPTKPKLTPEALDRIIQVQERLRHAQRGTLGGLARQWRASREWKALAPSTQKTWGSQLASVEEKWGPTPLVVWNDARMVRKVLAWRDSRAATPRAADLGVTVLRALLEFGRLRADVTVNVAEGVPTLYRGGSRAEIIWTDEDIQRFIAKATELESPHIADGLRLAALTGLRRADLVTLKWDHVGQTVLMKKALKSSRRTRRYATIPRFAELDQLLDELRTRLRKPGVETVLVNSFGAPWSADGFGGSFNRVRDAAEVVFVDPETGERRKKHLHDVRGTFATKLIAHTAALTDQEVADVMGWSPQQVAGIRRVYVDQARVVVAIGERIGGAL